MVAAETFRLGDLQVDAGHCKSKLKHMHKQHTAYRVELQDIGVSLGIDSSENNILPVKQTSDGQKRYLGAYKVDFKPTLTTGGQKHGFKFQACHGAHLLFGP
ncbi:hypothetical protein GN958_ATG20182 [Phytophthora infestans]|uniref:Uncharacterized protein n=1 Tax=Phytophthora infestans TaxID=4787 RepID=A0A8S9TQ46_PHYIN|nr:hypothetical protein GN958_ATG20182 [Phytophthora infestans]